MFSRCQPLDHLRAEPANLSSCILFRNSICPQEWGYVLVGSSDIILWILANVHAHPEHQQESRLETCVYTCGRCLHRGPLIPVFYQCLPGQTWSSDSLLLVKLGAAVRSTLKGACRLRTSSNCMNISSDNRAHKEVTAKAIATVPLTQGVCTHGCIYTHTYPHLGTQVILRSL